MSKILFINPISIDITLSLLEGALCKEVITIPRGDDFLSFPDKVVELVELHSIEEVWCICGPGAFTRMRIVTLTLGALRISRNIILKGCHFFDSIESKNPVLRANDSEYIIRGEDGDTSLVPKESLPKGTYTGYGEKNDFTDDKVLIEYSENFPYISSIFERQESRETLVPIYLKAPHITWSKKSTSPS